MKYLKANVVDNVITSKIYTTKISYQKNRLIQSK